MSEFVQFPPQQLPMSKKTKVWRKQVLDWGSSKATIDSALVRKSVIHKRINYDLLNGIIHMDDMMDIVNPDNVKASFIPNKIQHYPIMNSKLNVLRGEESERIFDYTAVVTNPNAISDMENTKKSLVLQELQQAIADTSQSEEEFNARLESMNDYFTFEYQDMREFRANLILSHYSKEYNMPLMFNKGFMDAMAVGEEMYQCDIVGGEPIIERLNPLKVRVYRSGRSSRIEDADIIIIEDYWNPGRIIDTYYDVLTKKDMEYIEKLPFKMGTGSVDSMDNIDSRNEFLNFNDIVSSGDAIYKDGFFWSPNGEAHGEDSSMLPYDMEGNIRVLRMFWKSRRKIKKIKYYDEFGIEQFKLREETYIPNEALGEEEQVLYINEAWEGTKIGEDIYVNMRPRVVQYNRLSNPSRCHFGIVGSIYNLNEDKPFSLVDMMKPFNYLYDVVHDRLSKLLAKNMGKIITLDLAKVPTGWDVQKWLYFAKTNNIAVVDSFKEGNIGASTGKLAGALNNASGVMDAELGNSIQQHINVLEYIKQEMSDVIGISKQREGQISNRETVGGVERATLQSSHITKSIFLIHDDIKKRTLECFLETAKIALRGRSKKFQYILSDGSMKLIDIDGDEFADCDYGIVVDNSNSTQTLSQKLDMLAQAALQNQLLDFSTVMKLYNSSSMAEKQRMVEKSERDMKQRQQESQQQQLQLQQQQMQLEAQAKEQQMQMEDTLNQRDNETKILVATIAAKSKQQENDGIQEPIYSEEAKANLMEKIRQFDKKMQLDREKLNFEKEKHKEDNILKLKLNNKQLNNKS